MDSTARYLASVYDKLPPEDGRLLLQFAEFLIEKQPRVISAREARRQVSVWLVRELGRDPATIRRAWCGGCACAPTGTEAMCLAGDRISADNDDDFGFVGTPQQVVEQMRPFVELGVDYFMFDCGGFPDLTTLEQLIDQALPAWGQA